ncbi:MAG: hypothetical protein LBH43_17270, partial [Treponema sp.]|nr:hypothetical protein [Treponema sp.]
PEDFLHPENITKMSAVIIITHIICLLSFIFSSLKLKRWADAYVSFNHNIDFLRRQLTVGRRYADRGYFVQVFSNSCLFITFYIT